MPATFEALFLTGWSPAPKQAQPATRGSATVSLARLAEELEKKKKKEEEEDGGCE